MFIQSIQLRSTVILTQDNIRQHKFFSEIVLRQLSHKYIDRKTKGKYWETALMKKLFGL